MSGTASYTYSLMKSPSQCDLILRSDGMVIPPDPANPNFAAWQAWISAGNKPTVPVVPQAVKNATALLAGGLAVTSTSTPALNGTYRTDGLAMTGIEAEMNALWISNSATFADGSASLNWPDKSGASHTFSIAQFKELVTAISLFQAQCAQYAAGILTTAPANSATIA